MKKLTFLALLLFSIIIAPVFISISQAQDKDSELGNMTFIISDNVSPSNMAEYEQWIKEFKAIADASGAPGYGVGQSDAGMSFFMNAGKSMTDYDALQKKFGDWFSKNPEVLELDKKYGHTRNFSISELWRHNPTESYMPDGYDNSIERNYTRVNRNYIMSGQVEEAKKIIEDYKATWKKAGISVNTRAYWNIFGRERECVAFVTSYESREAWLESRKEIAEKVGEAKLNELQSKWNAILRKEDVSISIGRPDLQHANP